MYFLSARGQMWKSKNCPYEIPYIVIGDVKFAGPKEAPNDICTDRIIGTGKG
jgi:hypothetical protein